MALIATPISSSDTVPVPARTAPISRATAIAAPAMPASGSASANDGGEAAVEGADRGEAGAGRHADHAGLGQRIAQPALQHRAAQAQHAADQQAERGARQAQLPHDGPADLVAEPPRPPRRTDRQRQEIERRHQQERASGSSPRLRQQPHHLEILRAGADRIPGRHRQRAAPCPPGRAARDGRRTRWRAPDCRWRSRRAPAGRAGRRARFRATGGRRTAMPSSAARLR